VNGRIPAALRSGGARRARWGIVDQVVSSVTNFAIVLVAAREATPREFGVFSLALALYIFLLWVGRSLVAEPFVVRHGATPPAGRREAAQAAVGAAVAVGLASAVVLLVIAALWRSSGGVLFAMALAMPGALVQDAYRYVLIADGRARAAAGNDSVWFAVQLVAVVILLAVGRASATNLTVAFAVGAGCAAFVASRQAGVGPRPTVWRQWLRDHGDLGVPFLLELVSVNGTTQLTLVGLGAVAGVVAVGELRAATLLFGPAMVLFAGVFLIGMTEGVRMRSHSPDRLATLVVGLATVTSLATLAWGVTVALLPDGVGTAVIGDHWRTARRLVAPVALLTAANACILAVGVGLRALAAARSSLRARLWSAPVVLVAGLVGAGVGDAEGAAVGLAGASWFGAVLAGLAFRHALARERDGGTPDAAEARITPLELGDPTIPLGHT